MRITIRKIAKWVLLPVMLTMIALPLHGCTLQDYQLAKSHQAPDWFHDIKFGVLIHWGPYNVPAWAPLVEPGDFFKPGFFKNHPYAEWYWNSMKIDGSPTQQHHIETYGADYSYYNFGPIFDSMVQGVDLEQQWIEVLENAGVKYIVFTTKHHDGYCMWPTDYPNPRKPEWHCSRDVVGDLCQAAREHGMKVGLYYSGGLDWTFTEDKAIVDVFSMLGAIPQSSEFTNYVNNHFRELIQKYNPDILWSDIGIPGALDRWALWADYYRKNPEGVINDRWPQNPLELIYTLANWNGSDDIPFFTHYDFFTPEYRVMEKVRKLKWETCRGFGWSFGYNQQEDIHNEHFMTVDEAVECLVDVVSKNGNLLLGLGPRSDGSIPEKQLEILGGVGQWLSANGQAIYATRPWKTAEGSANGGTVRIRFTQKADEEKLFAILLDKPEGTQVKLEGMIAAPGTTVRLLASGEYLEWQQDPDGLTITLPENLGEAAAYALEITPRPQ